MNEQDDLPVGEAEMDDNTYLAYMLGDLVPEMDDAEALRIFRETAFLHTSVKPK